MDNLHTAIQEFALGDWFRQLDSLHHGLDALALELRLEDEGTDAALKFLDETDLLLERIESRQWSRELPINDFPSVAALLTAMIAAHTHIRLVRETVFTAVHQRCNAGQARVMYQEAEANVSSAAVRLREAIARLREDLGGPESADT